MSALLPLASLSRDVRTEASSGRPVCLLFSGQGSQYYQMGRALYDSEPVFRGWMEDLDLIVARHTGESVIRNLYRSDRNKADAFERLELTHPAIVMFEIALAKLLLSRGVRPSLLLGASLGEFAAAAVAGVIPLERALELVVHHAEVIERHCPPGRMIAVLDSPDLYERDSLLRREVELAGVSFPQHFLLSGAVEPIARAKGHLRARGVMVRELPVRQGFHSSLMDPARPYFLRHAEQHDPLPPTVPIVSCAVADILRRVDARHFWDVARGPILLQRATERLERAGGYTYIDVGPSGTLATLMRYNLRPASPSVCLPIATPMGREEENLRRALQLANEATGVAAGSRRAQASIAQEVAA